MAPGSPCSFMARSSSATDAAGSLSGSVASAEKCFERSLAILPMQSLTSRAHCSGERRPLDVHAGRGEGDDLLGDAELVEHVLAVVDVAVAPDDDVVVAGIVHARVALGVLIDGDGAVALLQLGEVFGRVVVVVDVDDHRRRRLHT